MGCWTLAYRRKAGHWSTSVRSTSRRNLAVACRYPFGNDNQRIEIVVPIPDDLDGRTTVAIKLTPKPGSKPIYVGDIDDIPIDWEAKDKVGETSGYANEKIKVYRQSIAPKKPAQLNVGASGEVGSALSNITIAPQ